MTNESTANELRKTGISVIGDVRWGTHFCYFYETKQDLLETQVLYFKAGLESKEFCLWVVSQALSVEEAKHALGQAVPDLDRHLAEGALEIRGHDEWYLRDGHFNPQRVIQGWREKLNQTRANGYVGLRAAGDGGWIQNDNWMVFREYEQQVNAMIADQPSVILCTYPLATSPADQVFDVAHIHQVAVARRNGNWEVIETPELKEAKAEIKKLNEELEQKIEERTKKLAATNEALRFEIAERKLAEEAVKRGEDRLRQVIDTIPTMAWSLRPDGVLDFLNQRWLDYTGLSLEEAIEEPTRTVHPEDLSRVMEKWLVVKDTSQVYEDEMRLRRADGEYRWFLVRIAPLLDEQGNLLKRYGVSIDIEDRKQAEEALRKSEKFFAAFMDQLPGFAWMKDIEGRYVYVNKKESELDAYRAGAIGKTDAELWPAAIASAYRANDRQVITTRKAVQTVEPSVAYGEQRYMLVSKFPIFDQDGSIVMVAGAGVDITDRIRAEEALRESETRFRQLAENISAVFWLSNPEATLLHYVSPAYEKIWGRSCDSLYAEPSSWMDSVHPDDRERLAEDERLQAVGGRHDHTYRIVRPDGSLRWIRGRAFPVRDEAGKLIRVAGIAEDITERTAAEERLRRSEEKFKALFGIAPVGISILDGQHDVVDANPALEQILRLSKEELLNGTWRRRTYLNTDGTPRPPNEMVSARAITENRPINDVETGIVTENGKIIWTQVSAAPLALPDASAVVITQDITKRKRAEQALRDSEERFRELAENINEVFWVWTVNPGNGCVLYVSPAYETIWGRSCQSLYSSPQSWRKALHPQDKESVLLKIAKLDLEKETDLTYRIVRPDGSIRWLRDRIFPVRDTSGAVVRLAGIAEDITDLKHVELALDERLRFETLLTELSAAFANLPTPTVDQEIDKWLQNLVEFLDLDRAAFDRVEEGGMTLSRSHSHTARGIDPLSLNVADDQTPWITEQLLRGNTVKWSRLPDDIPEQASKEKEFAGRIGAKSVLSIPVCIGGSVICAISFTSMRIYREWPGEMVARLRLVGEIFANAIARKRTEEALFRREAELNEAQRLANIGSWEWDILADGVTCSNEVRRIYGREDQNSPDRPFSEAIHPDDRARRSAAVEAALNGGPPYNVEFRIIRPDKSVRFVHSRGRLIYDEAGKPVHMLGMTQDITERKRAAKELEEANHQLRFLSRRLFEIQEEERRHLARELHDEIGQALTAAKINLQSVTGNGGSATVARVQETTAILDRLLGQVRQISLDLRPSMLDDLGLIPALRSLLDQQGRRASVEVRFSAENIPEKLDPEIQTTCFRIAQEAITNAVRHAHATHIDLDLRCKNGKFRLLIRDNGIGFDVKSAQTQTVGLGLIGIKERAALVGGRATIISSPKKGTTVDVSLPLAFRAERQDRPIGR
jgi:PAS domain S-box-containing protein